ncbi:hypothetical protein D3C83_151110 [compost metagenome]
MRTDLDVRVAAHLVQGMLQQGVLEALMAESNIDLARLPDDPDAASKITTDAVLRVADAAIALLVRGIGTEDAARQM